MPIITQKWISRHDLSDNPDRLYLFGDNLMRRGMGGQAKEMRGEPNAVGVATKRAPTMNNEDFFCDDYFDALVDQMIVDLAPAVRHLMNGGTVVLPADGLGTGLSQLPQRAPNIHRFLTGFLEWMKTLKPE